MIRPRSMKPYKTKLGHAMSISEPSGDGYLRGFGFSQHVGKQAGAGIHARLLCLWASSQGQDPVVIDTISKLNKNISITEVSTRR